MMPLDWFAGMAMQSLLNRFPPPEYSCSTTAGMGGIVEAIPRWMEYGRIVWNPALAYLVQYRDKQGRLSQKGRVPGNRESPRRRGRRLRR